MSISSRHLRPVNFAGIFLLALCICGAGAVAAPLRVTTWNLEPNLAAGTNGLSASYRQNLIQETGEILKKMRPDVILLQGVPDWQTCSELVKELKPAKYNVAAWSSFRDAQTGGLSPRQTAILSKNRAYLSWSAAWKNDTTNVAPGGFAFAAVRRGGKNLGFFSVQLGGNDLLGEPGRTEAQQLAREESARQLTAQMDSLKNWTTNRIQSLVVGGDFNTSTDEQALAGEKTLPQLEKAGLTDTFSGARLQERITLPGSSRHVDATADYIFVRDAKTTALPQIVPTALTEHYPVTCDLELEATKAPPMPAHQIAGAESPPARVVPAAASAVTKVPPATQAAATTARPDNFSNWRAAGIAAGAVLALVILLRLARRKPIQPCQPVLLTMNAGERMSGPGSVTPERIVISPQSTETAGSAAANPPIVHIETAGFAQGQVWQQRAEEAERRAEQARGVVRQGLMGHLSDWLKTRIVQKLASDRAHLLATERAAALKMRAVDERLAKIEDKLQEHNRLYEKRIEELEQELSEAREENRELIRAKIAQVKADMERERAEAARRMDDKNE